MKIRDSGEKVVQIQKSLVGYGLLPRGSVDGQFGPQTDNALRKFQRQHGLAADGIAGPKTLSALSGARNSRLLKQDDLEKAAKTLDVDLAAVMAINEVESRGQGFLEDGRPVILFERHIMRRRLAEKGMNLDRWQEAHPNVVNKRSGGYEGDDKEWPRIGLAWSIHPDAAIESASWGLFQIMGFHWEHLGYESARAFMDAMRENEGRQLEAFVKFIKADSDLHKALQRLDWAEFAKRYNGPGYAKNAYDTRMAAAYDRHSAALEATV